MRTANGGVAAVGRTLCTRSTTKYERDFILDREAKAREFRRSLPKRKVPDSHKPGPVTWIQF